MATNFKKLMEVTAREVMKGGITEAMGEWHGVTFNTQDENAVKEFCDKRGWKLAPGSFHDLSGIEWQFASWWVVSVDDHTAQAIETKGHFWFKDSSIQPKEHGFGLQGDVWLGNWENPHDAKYRSLHVR